MTKGLKYAVLNNQDKKIINFLLTNGAKINHGNESALMKAIGNPIMVQYLINQGAKVNYQSNIGKTALHYAIQFEDIDSVKLLLKNKADINLALKSKNETIKNYGIYKDPPYSYRIHNGKKTPLMYAAETGNLKLIKFLIENGAKAELKDDNGQTVIKYSKNKRTRLYLESLTRK